MFTQGTILIDRTVADLYKFVAVLRTQLRCWDILFVPGLNELGDDDLAITGSYRLGDLFITVI